MPPSASSWMTETKSIWLKAIQAGLDAKRSQYLHEANQCEEYYGKDQKEIYTSEFTEGIGLFAQKGMDSAGIDGNAPRAPRFRVRDNAAAKAVQIFVPMFLQGEMVATVAPNKPFIPPPQLFGVQGDPNQPIPVPPPNAPPQVMQQYVQQEMARQQYAMASQQSELEYLDRQYRASIIQEYLNYSIKETGLEAEARPALRDAIVRGLGAMIIESVPQANGTGNLICANYLDDDHIVIDPDAKRMKDAKWYAILCEHNIWEVAAQYQAYGIRESDLRATSISAVGDITTRHHPATADYRKNLFRYWKIYSRCGIGARLKLESERDPMLNQIDQTLGDFCYIVVGEGCDYPLNLTPAIEDAVLQSQQIAPLQVVTSWPVPWYFDKDEPCPFAPCSFHERKGSPWPKSHLSFALGYLNFMAWILSFVADKAYRDSRGFYAIDSSCVEEVVAWFESGQDEEILKITKGLDGSKKIADLIEYIKGPQFDGTLIELYGFMKNEYQDMTGITELLQGQMDRQMRSAQEADVLQSASQLRPQDMANRVKKWLGRCLRKMAIAARYMQTGQDMLPILGTMGAQAWDNGIRTQNMAELFRESTYEVETGRGRTNDVNADLDNINQAMQFVFPGLMSAYQLSGDPSAVNGLLKEWGDARQMRNVESIFMPSFMPPPPPGSAEHEAEKEQIKEQKDQEKKAQGKGK